MGKSKDKEKDKKKKKDKERSSKKDKDTSKEKSRHKSDRRPSTDGEVEERHVDRRGSPSSSRSRRDKRDELKRKRSPDSIEHRSKRGHHEADNKDGEEPQIIMESKGSSDLSLSIENTNKLRLQLGLKPLDVGGEKGGDEPTTDNKEDGSTNEEGETKKKEPQHLPPKNIGEEAAATKMRDKLTQVRETREIAKKLSSVKGLGEADPDVDVDASDWVTKMREKAKEKEMAKKRAKLLEEMDDDFGVTGLIGAEFHTKHPSSKPPSSYTSKDLTGIKILHKEDTFKEGRDVVLTLKDSTVLDEDNGDVLVNVNMIDDEHASKNVLLKKGLPGYLPYEEEFDEYGNPKTRSLLYKYDEEIDGVKKDSFVLGEKGSYDVGTLEKEREESRRLLEQRAIKLEMPKSVVASEYYTSDEMVQFKKRKRRKKKDKFQPDNLVPLGNEEETKDHGSRRRRVLENETSENKSELVEEEQMDVDVQSDPVLLDEQDSTIDTALARTRRLLTGGNTSADRRTGAAFVATMVAADPRIKQEPVDDTNDEGMIILNTTAEFCRNIGEDFSNHDNNKEEVKQILKMEEDNNKEEQEEDDNSNDDMEEEEGSHHGGWTEVDPSNDTDDKTKKPSNDMDVLELDTVMSTGVAAALQMASKKGFFENEDTKVKKKDGSSKIIIDGLGVRDWEYERDRGREKDREREHGREMPFAEKSGYTPDINIEYVDNMGRLLTPKEAFRDMSHKFHGKTSGKRKSEKRLKRLQEEFLLNQASTVDTPLQTVELFRKRQEHSQSAYVVLSGAQQQHALNMTELAKRK